MDILIKNMTLPKKGNLLMVAIFSDGSVDWKRKDEMKTHRTTAIELPPHGRLIDADELLASDAIDWGEEAWNGIDHAPTVLEAST